MNSILEGIGILAIFFVIVYSYKKVLEHYYQRQLDYFEDERVYKAAEAFSSGASAEEVKAILAGCLGFCKGDVDEILSHVLPYRQDRDGCYKAFLSYVNMMIGEDVYQANRSTISHAA